MPKKPQKGGQKAPSKPVKKPDDAKAGYVSNIDADGIFFVAAVFPKGASEDGDVDSLMSGLQGRLFARTPGGCAASLVAEAIERAGKAKQPLTEYQTSLQYFWRNTREELPQATQLLNSGADLGVSGDDGGAEATSQLFDTGPEYNLLNLNRILDEAHLARPSVISERASWLAKERDLWISLAAAKIESASLKELVSVLALHMVCVIGLLSLVFRLGITIGAMNIQSEKFVENPFVVAMLIRAFEGIDIAGPLAKKPQAAAGPAKAK